ncbi:MULTISPECIES: (4Fe-4S)-binding protein [unclassified Arcicella]|uniref:(4Fe-4S)-binding protein n=1 Tax=unclassified Arcicella TaxID=2644986 RepID=UPI00285B4E1B|nr:MULTISPECIES: (4Fe-4S)-binding protein [unclassified Arcicella]MDR6560843.1 putative Fe-S cluster protein YjdI [Arcicella sp. BE51]MDR6810727.1 putative Fe-S cluster protein YjdI [Arcicella sp. BE140]MDR6822077.1 putative Fe-S cluster protein YjdI [Arcicella sp. BE139]
MEIKKKYSNGEVTVVWQPSKCIHSTICFKSLPTVFNPRKRPWVTLENEDTNTIVEQVKACPSSALSYFMNDEGKQENQSTVTTLVEVLPNGPLLVYGNLTVKDNEGNESMKSQTTAFCRCGGSSNKPYCDGAHAKIAFEG